MKYKKETPGKAADLVAKNKSVSRVNDDRGDEPSNPNFGARVPASKAQDQLNPAETFRAGKQPTQNQKEFAPKEQRGAARRAINQQVARNYRQSGNTKN